MSSENPIAEDEPGPSEVLRALQEALSNESWLKRSSTEEVAKQLNVGGYLQGKPSSSLVAEMLRVMRAGGLGLRSPTLQPCSLEVYWDADAGHVSDGIEFGLNLEWHGAPDLWEERTVPQELTHTKTPPCTDLISDAEATLRSRERWPTHLCEAEFMSQSTGLWAEAQHSIVDSVNIHRWAAMYPLPIGQQALMKRQEMDQFVEWVEVLQALPFEGNEQAMWTLRVEHEEGTVVYTLDLFGLAEYPTEQHQALDVPVAGDPEREARALTNSMAESDRLRAAYQDQQAAGYMTLTELGGKLRELEATRRVTQAELEQLLAHKERVEELEQDRDVLLEAYAESLPDALDDLSGEERNRLYGMLRLEVTPASEGLEVSGAFCTPELPSTAT